MQTKPKSRFRSHAASAWRSSLLLTCFAVANAYAQTSPDVPLISGGIGMFSTTNEGSTFLQPVIAPVLALPLGSHVLVESRADIRSFLSQNNNTGPFQSDFTAALEYLQADVIVNRHLTIVAGRFITPFGVYAERLEPIWVRNFQDFPLIFPIGTRTSGASDGVMVRGNLYASPKIEVNNTAFFSVKRTSGQFQAARAAGDRVDVFFPTKRLEIGGSFERFLQSTSFEKPHRNSAGIHVWWMPWRSPLQFRSEYAHGPHAEGYWAEAAYRLSQISGQDSWIGRFQPVFRMQQTFRITPQPGDGLPSTNAQQADFGFNYYLPHEVRLNTSYSRVFAKPNGNIWDISLTYRFLFPVWKGSK
jgi:hypothetical protein